jgi:WD40 repeat protein
MNLPPPDPAQDIVVVGAMTSNPIIRRKQAGRSLAKRRTLELAKVAQTGLARQLYASLWDVVALNRAVHAKGFEGVLDDARSAATDLGARPILQGLLRISHLIRRSGQMDPSHFLPLWRDRCLQLGWKDRVSQADRMLEEQGPRLLRYAPTPEHPEWMLTMEGHPQPIQLLAFSEDGRVLATASGEELCIWECETGRLRHRLRQPSGRICLLHFDSEAALTANSVGDIVLWDPAGGKAIQSWSTPGVSAMALGEDGLLAVGGWKGDVSLYRLGQSSPELVLPSLSDGVSTLIFGPAGAYLAGGAEDGSLCVWSIRTGEVCAESHQHSAITAIDFAVDGRIAVGMNDGELRIWDWKKERERSLPAHGSRITALGFQEGQLHVASLEGAVRSWSMHGELLYQWERDSDSLRGLALQSNGRRWVMGQEDGTAVLWQRSGRERHREELCTIDRICFGQGGDLLVAGYSNGLLQAWDGLRGELRLEIPPLGPQISAVRLLSEDSRIWAGLADGSLYLWDAETGRQIKHAKLPIQRASDLCFDHGGRFVVSSHWNGSLCLWSLKDQQKYRWKGDGSQIQSMAISPDGNLFAAGSHEGSLFVWDVRKGRMRHRLQKRKEPISSLDFTRDGGGIVVGWRTGALALWWPGQGWVWERRLESGVEQIRSDPREDRVAVATTERNLLLCSSMEGQRLARFPLPHRVADICFGPGDRVVAAAGGRLHFLQWVRPETELI